MANQVSVPLYLDLLNGFEGWLAMEGSEENESVLQLRQKAFEQFKQLGFPSRKVEDWKYTPVQPFLQEPFEFSPVAVQNAAHAAINLEKAYIDGLEAYKIVLVNGKFQSALSDNNLPAGVTIKPILEAQEEPAFAQYFGKVVNTSKYHFPALNTAFFSDGLFIEVAANTVVDKPFYLVQIYTGNKNLFVQPRNLVVANRSAGITIIESIVSENPESNLFVNTLTEVVVKENAQVNHYLLQTAGKGFRQVNHTEVSQKRDSVYSNYTFSLPGADLLRNNLHVNLDDEHTESHLYGLYLVADRQLTDNHSFVSHLHPNCQSNEVYKGVLLDKGTGVFNGKIFVERDAQKTNAFQQNNNLLLSNTATINSKPQLEIYADDVKCSHGSTVGQLSQEAMFYLKSRGIAEQTARRLLVSAFAFDVTQNIQIPALEEHINNLIIQHIPAEQELVKA
ncbi:Fe-S cluster assembly protein SufD [Adhaeribacter aquaticus]|uniref:Fe-S cluster assembly protein SufD n=1 Tax=Adhaeribacter aquaticus TaxID=299567 RepID=UPI0004251DE0|nr:Fe-S cluster assembly protein SufD [Adhaeribacter aquaticus]